MARDCLLPTSNTYAALIDSFAKSGLVEESLLWLKHMRSRAVSMDEVTMNTVLRVLKDSGRFDDALLLFNSWCEGKNDFDFLGLDYASTLDVASPTQFLLAEIFRTGCRAPVGRIISSLEEISPREPKMAATYNTLIDLFGKARRLKEASEAFGKMLNSGIAPDVFTFNTMMAICGSNGNLEEAEALLEKMSERRVAPDAKTFNILMTMHASAGNTDAVFLYYRRIREVGLRPDTVSNRIVLQFLCERKMIRELQDVLLEISGNDNVVDEQSIPVIMKMYLDMGLLEDADLFFEKHCGHGKMSSRNLAAVIDAYAKKGLWERAENIFFSVKEELLAQKDMVEYNVMLKAYGFGKQYEKACLLFEFMKRRGVLPDACTYNSLVQMYASGDFVEAASKQLEKMRDAGFLPNCETYSAVIASYSRQGLLQDAVNVFEEMKAAGVELNEVVFGLLVDMFAEAGDLEVALQYCEAMKRELGLAPNRIICTSLIKAYGKAGCWKEAQDVYSEMKGAESGVDVVASNCMINLYAGLGMVAEAKAIFNELRRSSLADSVTYSSMIYLFKSMGMLGEAIHVAREYQRLGLLSDSAACNTVLACYAAVDGMVRECAELMQYMLREKIPLDAATFKMVCTTLKKGSLPPEAVQQLMSSYDEGRPCAEDALLATLFSLAGMHSTATAFCSSVLEAEGTGGSATTYNVGVRVFGASGQVEKALSLYMRMQDEGIEPDVVTYAYLASCYGKAGMVEGLKRIFALLECGDLEPNESLYRSLIGAFGEVGKPELAKLVEQELRSSWKGEEDAMETER